MGCFAQQQQKSDLPTAAANLDRVTALLCGQCRKLSEGGNADQLTPEVAAWYKEHEAFDRQRTENANSPVN